MEYARHNVRNSLIVTAVICAITVSAWLPLRAVAQTTIRAVVCSNIPADLTITSPLSGTTVAQNPVQISGTIARVSQIRLKLDGTYVKTVPTTPNDTTYNFMYSMPAGTHTLTLTGIDSCQLGDAEQSLVLTLNASAPVPSPNANGNSVKVPGKVPEIPEPSPLSDFEQSAVGRALAGLMYNALVGMDFGSRTSLEQVPANVGRFTLTAVGLTATVFPTALYAGYRGLKMTMLANILPHVPAVATTKTVLAIRVLGFSTFLIPIIFMR